MQVRDKSNIFTLTGGRFERARLSFTFFSLVITKHSKIIIIIFLPFWQLLLARNAFHRSCSREPTFLQEKCLICCDKIRCQNILVISKLAPRATVVVNMSTWQSALVICAFGVFSFCAAFIAVCEVGFLQEMCSSLTAPNKLDSSVILLSVLLIFIGVWALRLPSDQVRPSILLLILTESDIDSLH